MNQLTFSDAIEVTSREAYFLLRNSGGKFFRVTFQKRDGTTRDLVGRIGVYKGTNGIGMPYNPADHKNLIVWDAAIQDYRTVRSEAIIGFRLNGKTYHVSEHRHIDPFDISWSMN